VRDARQELEVTMDRAALVCEFQLDGELILGDVVDLSHAGFVVETAAAPELGREFELRLVGGAARHPLLLRGIVESRVPHGALGVESHPRVRFRLLRFSEDYGQLIAGGAWMEPASHPDAQPGQATRGDGERQWLSDLCGSGNLPRPPTPNRKTDRWGESAPLLDAAGTSLWSDEPLVSEAIVIDDGELDDVVESLVELGVKVERQAPAGDSIAVNWVPPEKLLVSTAKRALKLRLPLQSTTREFVSIAVADSDARMICPALRRLGFDYTISRPVHPLALWMLLRQAIFEDDDHRVAPRQVLGCAVRWWCAWGRKQPGVILDVSATGCQLLVRGPGPGRPGVKIRVPDGVSGRRGFTLVGQVVRSSPGRGETKLGISFEAMSNKLQARLQEILDRPGPCRLTGDPSLLESEALGAESRIGEWEERRRDRRLNARGAMQQEVVALEHGSSQAKHLLVSSDLSVEGMRIEAQPALALEEQLDLALYEDSEGGPLVLSAVVARDDGRRGWWLRFVGVTPDVRGRLERALERFPPVTRLDVELPESGRVVLGQVLVRTDATGDEEMS